MALKGLLLAVLLAADAADDSPMVWTINSGNSAATLSQKPSAPGRCFLECKVGEKVEWSTSKAACFGEKSDRKFLADDCVRTVVMIASPKREKTWKQTTVVRVYKKEKLEYPVMGIAALPDERLIKSNPSWLKGCYGVDGEPPRYSKDGLSIEYETIDGKSHTVPLKAEK